MRIVVLVALLLGLSLPAAAESRSKLFPLTSNKLPKSLRGAPAELSRVLARSLGAELTPMPIEDAADLINCVPTTNGCLESVAKSAGVSKIYFGRVDVNDDGDVIVRLSTWEVDRGESGRKYTLTGETVDDVTQSLRDALDNKQRKADPPPPPTRVDPTPVPAETSGGVSKGTWGMIIGGVVVAGVGGGVLASNASLKKQIAKLDPQDREDFDQLLALEKAGKQRVKVGGAMLAVGGAVAAVGVIRAIVQKQSKPEKPMLDVVPETGGASVVLTLGWH